jgi:bifunctional DNase/RNase
MEELPLVRVDLARIIMSDTDAQQIIVLAERLDAADGEPTGEARAFPIVIGMYEAAAIHRGVSAVDPVRPQTHDLVATIIEEMGGTITRVAVTDLRDSTFYARVTIEQKGEIIEIDARPSDAIALAVKANAPIFVSEHVLDSASSE